MLLELKLDVNVLAAKTGEAGDNQQDDQDVGALHMAVAKQQIDIIDLIIVHAPEVDVNLLSPSAGTPLHVACRVGNLKIA